MHFAPKASCGQPVPAAFVDVDETLVRDITFLSLFEFDAYRATGRLDEEFDVPRSGHERIRQFRALRAAGLGRAHSHRWFYRSWAGRDVTEVHEIGREWFAFQCAAMDYFNHAVVDRLAELAAGGTRIVLVSGSFDAALRPIAEQVGADAMLCTDLEVVDGRYTGAVMRTMVGPDKAAALRRYAAATGIDLRDCAAFGDHHTDIAMFDLVGHAVVVGDSDPQLRTYPADRLPG
ncbi:HAD-superfamily subfamily IB hydrolase, TIGR01490 [Nocardia amikacinitolerans]|uniref:HAD family hydrolase n=1 Tax=Nocardia amikacinitolerans TaxID=756689 RepID=UPI000836354E|nr:HAD-IB family hydrolase [Nocardia amikacinitolerans]MCP2314745.1 HAD-superfamily subfamily IB hydrolase, TIGR01490 [Nocardia amikacinitolerans]